MEHTRRCTPCSQSACACTALCLCVHCTLTRSMLAICLRLHCTQFKSMLVDNLNAEIVLGTVSNVREASAWLSYT